MRIKLLATTILLSMLLSFQTFAWTTVGDGYYKTVPSTGTDNYTNASIEAGAKSGDKYITCRDLLVSQGGPTQHGHYWESSYYYDHWLTVKCGTYLAHDIYDNMGSIVTTVTINGVEFPNAWRRMSPRAVKLSAGTFSGEGSALVWHSTEENTYGTIPYYLHLNLNHSSNGSWSSNDNGHWNTCRTLSNREVKVA